MRVSWSKRLYRLGTGAYQLGIRLATPFSSKARAWTEGRQDTASAPENFQPGEAVVWFHCASVGEFEQGRPLIELLKSRYQQIQIVLTFFSPSGYMARKNFALADLVLYLPADNEQNARRFMEMVRPSMAIFVKYEFWGSYLEALQQRKIPAVLLSAIFRPGQPFFQWWGSYHRFMLTCFSEILVQDDASALLLHNIGILSVVCPDLRFDRVLQIASQSPEVGLIKEMSAHRIIIAGSTWPEDEQYLAEAYNRSWKTKGFKLIIAPHEPTEQHIQRLMKRFKGDAVRFSEATLPLCPKVLIIDSVGMLSSIYRYGYACYIGGGFGAGIHNTLEAAVYGKPLAFGPRIQKFREARILTELKVATVITRAEELMRWTDSLTADENNYRVISEKSSGFVAEHKGGAEKALKLISKYLPAEP